MKTYFILSAFLYSVMLGCSPTFQVFSDQDKEADIADYSMYTWLSQPAIEGKGLNPLYYNELNDKRIKNAVNKQLQAKGFTLMNGVQPLELHYHIVVEDKALITTEPSGFSYGNSLLLKRTTVYPYKEGTLIVDLVNSKTNQLVWRGWVTGAIEPEIRENPEEAIEKAVVRIFKIFPYKR